jgi:hypothetical protein
VQKWGTILKHLRQVGRDDELMYLLTSNIYKFVFYNLFI